MQRASLPKLFLVFTKLMTILTLSAKWLAGTVDHTRIAEAYDNY